MESKKIRSFLGAEDTERGRLRWGLAPPAALPVRGAALRLFFQLKIEDENPSPKC